MCVYTTRTFMWCEHTHVLAHLVPNLNFVIGKELGKQVGAHQICLDVPVPHLSGLYTVVQQRQINAVRPAHMSHRRIIT